MFHYVVSLNRRDEQNDVFSSLVCPAKKILRTRINMRKEIDYSLPKSQHKDPVMVSRKIKHSLIPNASLM